jgi:alpha-beta hydrolase superfamily lysophospholipase
MLTSGELPPPVMIEMMKNLHILPISSKSISIIINFIPYFLDSRKYTATDYAPQIDIPIIYIHGENDHCANPEWSKLAYDLTASQEKDLVYIPNANHFYKTSEGESVAHEALSAAVEWFNRYLLVEE